MIMHKSYTSVALGKWVRRQITILVKYTKVILSKQTKLEDV